MSTVEKTEDRQQSRHDNKKNGNIRDVKITIDHGRIVSINARGNVVKIGRADGGTELTITISSSGPVVSIFSGALEVETLDTFNLAAKNIRLTAANEIVLETKGDMATTVGGNMNVSINGERSCEAEAQEIKARRGDVVIYANDDVCLDGERIRNNC